MDPIYITIIYICIYIIMIKIYISLCATLWMPRGKGLRGSDWTPFSPLLNEHIANIQNRFVHIFCIVKNSNFGYTMIIRVDKGVRRTPYLGTLELCIVDNFTVNCPIPGNIWLGSERFNWYRWQILHGFGGDNAIVRVLMKKYGWKYEKSEKSCKLITHKQQSKLHVYLYEHY